MGAPPVRTMSLIIKTTVIIIIIIISMMMMMMLNMVDCTAVPEAAPFSLTCPLMAPYLHPIVL